MELKTLLLSALGLLAIAGCASTTPHLDQHFGLAVNAAKAQQTLNPDASRNPDPVSGMGGIAADNAIDEYHKSFVTPEPTFPVISIGGGGGGR